MRGDIVLEIFAVPRSQGLENAPLMTMKDSVVESRLVLSKHAQTTHDNKSRAGLRVLVARQAIPSLGNETSQSIEHSSLSTAHLGALGRRRWNIRWPRIDTLDIVITRP